MASHTQGIGLFTAENIAAMLQAIPDSNGTYVDIAGKAQEHGAILSPYTISSWVNRSRADIRARRNNTAYARFAKQYDQLRAEHRGSDANRNREFNRALEILERTCECGNDKVLLPDGKLAEQCRECQNKVPKSSKLTFRWYSTFFALRAAIQPS